ncbi:MAG: hypothetical protein K2K77_01985 [Duncaniella sp.]|nr:hypothetical protein [Duncaniella sp.]
MCGCAVTSCSPDAPRDEMLTNGGQTGGGGDNVPGSGHRPGLGEIDNSDRELKDDVLRVKGTGVNLRYDRGGILFVASHDGSVRIVDLDGADEVSVIPGKEGSDSLMTGASLTVNGRKVALSVMKKMRLAEGRIWYMAADTAGDNWVIVLPQ